MTKTMYALKIKDHVDQNGHPVFLQDLDGISRGFKGYYWLWGPIGAIDFVNDPFDKKTLVSFDPVSLDVFENSFSKDTIATRMTMHMLKRCHLTPTQSDLERVHHGDMQNYFDSLNAPFNNRFGVGSSSWGSCSFGIWGIENPALFSSKKDIYNFLRYNIRNLSHLLCATANNVKKQQMSPTAILALPDKDGGGFFAETIANHLEIVEIPIQMTGTVADWNDILPKKMTSFRFPK